MVAAHERRPVLLVIDEAHNLCSPELAGPLLTAVKERIIQIAAERQVARETVSRTVADHHIPSS